MGWDINLNGAENGVFLPSRDFPNRQPSLHLGGPSRAYTQYVNDALGEASTKEEALEVLDDIRAKLLSGELKINNTKGLQD